VQNSARPSSISKVCVHRMRRGNKKKVMLERERVEKRAVQALRREERGSARRSLIARTTQRMKREGENDLTPRKKEKRRKTGELD